MLATRDQLDKVSLVAFLEAFSEPAFILCCNSAPHEPLDFIYGNPALHSLIFGEDDSGVLDKGSFFSALASDEDVFWLSNPARPQTLPTSVSGLRLVGFRPSWLPRDHTPLSLELTSTSITLPVTMFGVHASSKSHVFTASPRKAAMDLLRSDPGSDFSRRRDSGLRLHDLPQLHPSAGQLVRSRNSKSESSSWPSQQALMSKPMEMPTSLLETFPWDETPLGPKALWPTSLKTMLSYLMEKPIPSAVFWGFPELTTIYNDAYARMMRVKHPGAFGKGISTAWSELWEMLGPVIELCRAGKATFKTDDPLFFNSLTDLCLPEEVYHSWHWTPIWQEDGTVGGVFNTTYDTTQKVIAERRLAVMSDLFAKLSEVRTQAGFVDRTLQVFSRNPLDMPFVALYWCHAENTPTSNSKARKPNLASGYLRHLSSGTLVTTTLTLAGSVGIPDNHPAAQKLIKYTLDPVTFQPISRESAQISASPSIPGAFPHPTLRTNSDSTLSSQSDLNGWEFATLFASGHIELVDPLPPGFATGLGERGFGDVPRVAAMLPIWAGVGRSGAEGHSLPQAILLTGLNTRRAYDADYAAWLESLSASLGSQLTAIMQRESDAKMMEEREKMDKAKTMFFTNASHELRTPLTLIQAPLEQLMTSQNLHQSSLYKVQLALRNTRRLQMLVNSILDMSKVEAGRLLGRFQPVRLGQVVSDLAALFRSIAEKKGIEFEVSNNKKDPPFVYVDIDLWEKITCNLLSNAFKYTIQGKVTLAVDYDESFAYMHVTDTGVGIPSDQLEQVFERFFRVNGSRAEGTGIGLSLTKELVALHGGELTLTSRSKEEYPQESGSTFTVTVPLGSTHLSAGMIYETEKQNPHGLSSTELGYWMGVEAGQPTPSISSGDDDAGSTVSSAFFFEKDDALLVVDDNEDMRGYIRKIFSPYLTVFEAKDGSEALEIAKTQKLNMVLCDVLMHGMSGPEVLAKLREEKQTRLVPVIFVTASDDVGLFAGKTEGVVDCISKPFKVRDLLARVHLQVQLGKRLIKLQGDFDARTHELETLIELSTVGIFRTDATGKLTYLNSTWYQIVGYPTDRDKDEWLDFIHPESNADALRVWRGCFERHETSSTRLRWVPDTWTHACITPLFSPHGTFAGAFGTITDINEQHKAEEARIALAEEKEHIAAMKAADAEAQRLLEVERRRAQELLIDVTSHELRQPVSAIIQNAEVVSSNMKELRDLLEDCRKRGMSYAPTEQVINELDDDLQAMDSITQCGLAQARIANDVLSLSRIQLNVLSVLPTEFDIRRETSLILMVFRNELATKNINFTLDLGRGADLFGVSSVCTDRSRFAQIITNLMSNAIRFVDMSPELREIKVFLEISPDPPMDETCVPPPLPPRRPIVQRSPESESGELFVYIYVSVQDSGPGLQKEDLALLFQRFQQGSNAHHVFGGSGLGLFVCRQLCNLMGGRIEVESELGKGAIFRFFIKATLPADRTRRPPIGSRQRRSSSVLSKTSGASRASVKSGSRPLPAPPNLHLNRPLHVLITEDNKINQTVLARQMKRAGFTFALASNGLESIQAIEKADPAGPNLGAYDVVLMDLEMPVMDGFAATREIRAMEMDRTLQNRSFIIALTGNARHEQVQAARDAGVDDVVIKPYQIETLIAKMRAGYRSIN
ncbi:hypothetical protein BDV93DRAFT_523732 [Ceratobasidium sp. AG-I]|nr:hypothetical protein BDV93DRAFT_523732 [Ceratobasidium sp. AG-I]